MVDFRSAISGSTVAKGFVKTLDIKDRTAKGDGNEIKIKAQKTEGGKLTFAWVKQNLSFKRNRSVKQEFIKALFDSDSSKVGDIDKKMQQKFKVVKEMIGLNSFRPLTLEAAQKAIKFVKGDLNAFLLTGSDAKANDRVAKNEIKDIGLLPGREDADYSKVAINTGFATAIENYFDFKTDYEAKNSKTEKKPNNDKPVLSENQQALELVKEKNNYTDRMIDKFSENKEAVDKFANTLPKLLEETREKVQQHNSRPVDKLQVELRSKQTELNIRVDVESEVKPNSGETLESTKANMKLGIREGVEHAIEGPMKSMARKIDTILNSSVRSDKNKYEAIEDLLKGIEYKQDVSVSKRNALNEYTKNWDDLGKQEVKQEYIGDAKKFIGHLAGIDEVNFLFKKKLEAKDQPFDAKGHINERIDAKLGQIDSQILKSSELKNLGEDLQEKLSELPSTIDKLNLIFDRMDKVSVYIEEKSGTDWREQVDEIAGPLLSLLNDYNKLQISNEEKTENIQN